MQSLKHVGRIKNTGRRCVVVFRVMFDERGNVTDENNCLVFETESLPDAEHQDLMRIVEGQTAQQSPELYNVLNRERLGNGQSALAWLHSSNRLRKFPTSNIELTPDNNTVYDLDKVNKIVKMQQSGMSQQDIEKTLQDDTDSSPRESTMMSQTKEILNETENQPDQSTFQSDNNGVLDDSTIAQNYVKQAEIFEQQANDLRKQAEELDPSLKRQTNETELSQEPKKKRGRPPKKQQSANSEV